MIFFMASGTDGLGRAWGATGGTEGSNVLDPEVHREVVEVLFEVLGGGECRGPYKVHYLNISVWKDDERMKASSLMRVRLLRDGPTMGERIAERLRAEAEDPEGEE